jgi:hypothetical protein
MGASPQHKPLQPLFLLQQYIPQPTSLVYGEVWTYVPQMLIHEPVPGFMSAHVFTPVDPVQFDLPPPIARSMSTGRQRAPTRAINDRTRDICRASNCTPTSHPEIHAIVRERQLSPLLTRCIVRVCSGRATTFLPSVLPCETPGSSFPVGLPHRAALRMRALTISRIVRDATLAQGARPQRQPFAAVEAPLVSVTPEARAANSVYRRMATRSTPRRNTSRCNHWFCCSNM